MHKLHFTFTLSGWVLSSLVLHQSFSSDLILAGDRQLARVQAFLKKSVSMGRGVSYGGGQSSLGYLFGSGESPKPAALNVQTPPSEGHTVNNGPTPKPGTASPPVDVTKQIPAGIHSNSIDRQNTGNFITDRPSTKVHSAPGGGSSLGYLFGSGGAGSN